MKQINKNFRVGSEGQYDPRMAGWNLHELVNMAVYTELVSERLFVDSLLGKNNVIPGVSDNL